MLDTARAGGALIRDKDGMALLLAPAEEIERREELAVLAADYLRLIRAVAATGPDVAAYGGFAWVTVFDPDDRRQFVEEMSAPLLVALSGGAIELVRTMIEDWQATAEVWADDALRSELLEPADEPLHDIEL